MEKLIILNHKMNLIYDEVYEYIDMLNNLNTSNNIIVLPSDVYLETFISNCSWAIGSQNVYHEIEGSFTGEISTLQLKSLGIEYVLVGHSERKLIFKESDKDINLKLKASLDSNIIPILFLGEKENEEVLSTIKKQLDHYLTGIKHIEFIIFAYEPIWAIGNGKTASIEHISKVTDYIDDYLFTKYKINANIVYGGSVNKDNINNILKISKINGVAIGSISANKDKIKEIIETIN